MNEYEKSYIRLSYNLEYTDGNQDDSIKSAGFPVRYIAKLGILGLFSVNMYSFCLFMLSIRWLYVNWLIQIERMEVCRY